MNNSFPWVMTDSVAVDATMHMKEWLENPVLHRPEVSAVTGMHARGTPKKKTPVSARR